MLLIATYTSLILVNAAFNLAFSIWMLHAYFSSIPVELEEAAMLDGCGYLWSYFSHSSLLLFVETPGFSRGEETNVVSWTQVGNLITRQ